MYQNYCIFVTNAAEKQGVIIQNLPESWRVFCDVTPRNPAEVHRRFGEISCLHLQACRILVSDVSVTCLIYSSNAKIGEDGGTTFLLNGGNLRHDMAPRLRGKYHSSLRIHNYRNERLWEPQIQFIWRHTRSYEYSLNLRTRRHAVNGLQTL
jgi:hypothetical protein